MWTVFLLCKHCFSAVQEKFQHNSISISSVKLVFLQYARSISSLWTEYFFTVQTTFLYCPGGISSLCNQYFFSVQAAALHIVLAVHYCEAAFCSQAATERYRWTVMLNCVFICFYINSYQYICIVAVLCKQYFFTVHFGGKFCSQAATERCRWRRLTSFASELQVHHLILFSKTNTNTKI